MNLQNPEKRTALSRGFGLLRWILGLIAYCAMALFAQAQTAPSVSFVSPANNSSFAAPATITFTGSVTPGSSPINRFSVLWNSGNSWSDGGQVSGSTYQVGVGNLPAGTYQFWLKVWANDGGVAESQPITVVVTAHVNPTATFQLQGGSSTFVAPAAIPFTGTVTAGSSPVNRASILWNDGNSWSDLYLDSNGSFAVALNGFSAGTYRFWLKTWDNGGGVGESQLITVVVASHVNPTATLQLQGVNGNLLAPASISFAGTVTPGSSLVNRVSILWNDGNSWNDLYWDSNGNGSFTATLNGFPAGIHQFFVKVWDSSGATAVSSTVAVTVTPNTPPTVSLASPVTGLLAPATITLSATASDADGPVTVKFYNGSTYLADGTLTSGTSSNGTFNYTWANIPQGSYAISAKATDGQGNVVSTTPIAIPVAANPPLISVTVPPGGNNFTAPANIPLSALATSVGYDIQSVRFYSNGALIGPAELASGTVTSGAWVTNAWTNLAAGSYQVTAVVRDESGVSATSSPVTYTVGSGVGSGTTLYFVNSDHLATPRLIENQLQQTVWTWSQDEPFGDSTPNGTSSSGSFVFNLAFPGQYRDQETGTNYNNERDYDPNGGRYVQSDPIGLEGGFNTYSYVNGAPLTRVDPNGLDGCRVVGGFLECSFPSPGGGGASTPGNTSSSPKHIDDPILGTSPNSSSSPIRVPEWFPKWAKSPAQCEEEQQSCKDKAYAAYEKTIALVCKPLRTRRAREACYSNAAIVLGDELAKCDG